MGFQHLSAPEIGFNPLADDADISLCEIFIQFSKLPLWVEIPSAIRN